MNKTIAMHFIRSRWAVRLSAVAGLVFIPACGMSSALRSQPDHVFSTRSPAELEYQSGSVGVPVKAEYPDEGSVRMSDVNGATAAYGRPMTAAPASTPAAGSVQTTALAATRIPWQSAPQESSVVSRAIWNAKDEPNPFQLASYRPEEPANGIQQATFIAAEPRQEVCPPSPYMNQMETVATGPSPDLYPDEYVFDGGDRGAPVHYGAGDRLGLETEDTVAEFEDHTGDHRVRPSNRVAVYAPRFGAVRTISGLETDIKVDMAVGARDAIAVGNLKTGQRGETTIRSEGIVGLDTRNRADGMETALPPSQAEKTDAAILSRKVDQGHEDLKYTSAGQFGKLDSPMLNTRLQNAVVWTRNLFPQITVNTLSAGEITANFKLQEVVGVEDQRVTKGDLRIIKLADRSTAQSGDTVSFTIQFENVGDFDVYEVRIVDNLTPRLQYVEGTATIDEKNPGEVTVTPNGEGSHILTFILDNPLKGHTGGVITFDARVR